MYVINLASLISQFRGFMQVNLLNSIIKITKNRDVESLEYTIISTIQEFITCSEITIYKDLSIEEEPTIERSASVQFSGTKEFTFFNKTLVDTPDPELISCLRSSCIITEKSADNKEHRWLPICVKDKAVGAIVIISEHLESEEQVLLNAFCRIFENYLSILHESETDTLTGLLNRQTFDQKLKLLLEKQLMNKHKTDKKNDQRDQNISTSSWLAILDIDNFKMINDQYGHVCGDEVLLVLAQKMKAFFRSTDLIFRFGGEEFVIVFEPTDLKSIEKRLNTFLELIREANFPFIPQLTLSIGFAKISPYDFPISVIENADKALYYAKQNGRDQLCFYDELIDKNLIDTNKDNHSDIDLF